MALVCGAAMLCLRAELSPAQTGSSDSNPKAGEAANPAPATPFESAGDRDQAITRATPAAGDKTAEGASPSQQETGDPQQAPDVAPRVESGKVAVLKIADLKDFEKNPEPVREVLEHAAELTRMGLEYQFASAKPTRSGMDCSGTIYYLLRQAGIEGIPRASNRQYRWLWQKHLFRAVNGETWESFEFSELRPGDLLFWIGTYETDRDPAVSHVMMYAGFDEDRGKHVMFGASEGRAYAGKPRYGVSAFDFKGPTGRGKTRFIGYAKVPGLTAEEGDE